MIIASLNNMMTNTKVDAVVFALTYFNPVVHILILHIFVIKLYILFSLLNPVI